MQRLDFLKNVRIGIDIDGCITDHDATFCRYWNKLNPAGAPLAPSDLAERSFTDPPAEERKITARIFHDARYWIELPTARGASGVIQQLMAWGAHVRLFTARWLDYAWMETHPAERLAFWEERRAYAPVASRYEELTWWIRAVTTEWLRRNHIPYDVLILDNAKSGATDRFAMAGGGMLDVMIDDNPRNVRRLAEHVPVLMPDHWYNREVRLLDGRVPIRVGWHSDVMAPDTWRGIGECIAILAGAPPVEIYGDILRELAAMELEPAL